MMQASEPPPVSKDQPDKHRSGRDSAIELVLIVITALGLALLIQAFLVKPFRIPSESMVPTLEIGQRVLVNRLDGRFGTPERGDIVVFHPPAGADETACGVTEGQEYAPGLVFHGSSDSSIGIAKMPCAKPTPGESKQNFIKRVIGLPGERLKIIKGNAYINGRKLSEPYINPASNCDAEVTINTDCTFSREIVIPPKHYFMMGDNRDASADSRFWGPVPQKQIVGPAFATYWPPNRIGVF